VVSRRCQRGRQRKTGQRPRIPFCQGTSAFRHRHAHRQRTCQPLPKSMVHQFPSDWLIPISTLKVCGIQKNINSQTIGSSRFIPPTSLWYTKTSNFVPFSTRCGATEENPPFQWNTHGGILPFLISIFCGRSRLTTISDTCRGPTLRTAIVD
jgi:hypothetical protein